MKPFDRIFLSCEHATNHVPPAYEPLFAGRSEVLETHRGYDIGIEPVAETLAQRLHCPLVKFPLSRLLIEPNRSRRLFSEFSEVLPKPDQQMLLEQYYRRYRESVRSPIQSLVDQGHRVLHLSLHSFTPVLRAQVRKADIGLLYDPRRAREKDLAMDLQAGLATDLSLRIRRNYPYLGAADGMTTWLRRTIQSSAFYIGLEIEINQALLQGDCQSFRTTLCEAFHDILCP